jgi:hypothetical protein
MKPTLDIYLKQRIRDCEKSMSDTSGTDQDSVRRRNILSVKIASLKGRLYRLKNHASVSQPEYSIPRNLTIKQFR